METGAAELLRIYHYYMRVLGFELLPALVERVLGDAGFGPLARLYADATRSYIEKYLGGGGDPRRLLEMLSRTAEAAREAIGEEPLFNFTVSVEEDRLVIEAPMDSMEGPGARLRPAVMLGIVAGILEASGYKTYVVTKRERAKHLPPGSVVLYAERRGGKVRIIAEYASNASGATA